MKVLVFGKTGQVAQALLGYDGITALSRAQADLSDPEICKDIIARSDADVIINAAAYTAVDVAQSDEKLAFMINAEAPAAMASAAAKRKIPFLHISTDYVFDGSGAEARHPDAPTNPLNVYGRSKLAGEAGVIAAGGVFAILRTSWVFSSTGSNFVKTMLRLGGDRDKLSIVNDQIGGPTPAADIADALMRMATVLHQKGGASGVYHFTGAPDVSWAEFAKEIFHQSGLPVNVNGIATSDYPTPATRPLNSRLDCRILKTVFDISRPDWRKGLGVVLHELGGEHA